jgi:hypothetical protein
MALKTLAIVAGLTLFTAGSTQAQSAAPLADSTSAAVEAFGEPQQQQAPKPPDDSEAKKPPTPPHTGVRALFRGLADDVTHLPSRNNAYIALAGAGLALAVHPADSNFNTHLRSHYRLVNDIYKPAKYYGDTPVQVGLSLGAFAYGRIFDAPKVSHLGMDLLQSQILTEGLVQGLKLAARRERPDQSNHKSFPSGHAAITFAGATVLERHLGWKKSALAYLIAAYVSSSRLHDNVHYLSDVVAGAAIGTIVGRTVTKHGQNEWGLAPVSVPGGMAVMAFRNRGQ